MSMGDKRGIKEDGGWWGVESGEWMRKDDRCQTIDDSKQKQKTIAGEG
jgi:hypothetical protein